MKTLITITLILSLAVIPIFTKAEEPPPAPAQEQPEVLTSGPLHEAFAEPVNLQNQEGLVAPTQPPADIQETPPLDRPAGENYVWVPGYWSWDGVRHNYLWVSACWRAAPPRCSWVPGYWYQTGGGWEWVAGFWMPGDFQDIEYLPAPPPFNYVQPGPPPSPDVVWVPPCPYWDRDHYIERPGYWLEANPNWLWVPSHYIWTPRGYVFCEGRWDYPIEHRGVLFAPVYFSPSVHISAGFFFSPNIVVDLDLLTVNLFTYPRYCHYFFGDCYDDAYINIGIFPIFEVERRHTWYDPIFVHERWRHRDDKQWEENERHEYDRLRADKNIRPPRTYHDMETRVADKKLPEKERNSFRMAEPLNTFASNKQAPVKFQHINAEEQQTIVKHAANVHSYTAQRSKWESSQTTQKPSQPPPTMQGERKAPEAQPQERTAPGERRPPSAQPPEQAKPGERQPPAAQPPEQTKPGERQPPPAQPPERKAPEQTKPEERKASPPPAEHKEQAAPSAENKNRETGRTESERVKVPSSPVRGQEGGAQKASPERPGSERKYQGEEKKPPKESPGKGSTERKEKEK